MRPSDVEATGSSDHAKGDLEGKGPGGERRITCRQDLKPANLRPWNACNK